MILIHSTGEFLGYELYWGIEYEIPVYDTKHVSFAWLVEDLPPYRRSKRGARIRIGDRALHFGSCTRATDPHRRLTDVSVADISSWRGPHVQEEDSDTGREPVRPPEQRQLVPDAGREPGDGNVPG